MLLGKVTSLQVRPGLETAKLIASVYAGQGVSQSRQCPLSNVQNAASSKLLWRVLQSIILLLGGLISVLAILIKVPGGFTAVVAEGHRHNKLSLGRAEWSWEERTVPTVLTYAAVHYMTKFITFQDAVQRYLAVPSHKVHSTLPNTPRLCFLHCTCILLQPLAPCKPTQFTCPNQFRRCCNNTNMLKLEALVRGCLCRSC